MTAKIIISAVNPEETRMGIVENGRLLSAITVRSLSEASFWGACAMWCAAYRRLL